MSAAAQQTSAPRAQTAPPTPPQQTAPAVATSPAAETAGSGGAAQPAVQPQGGTVKFTVEPTEVELPVTVTDDQGKFIRDLTRDDFRVLDEGKTQRIEWYSHTEKQPVVVGFLMDLSSASKTQWDKFQAAANELIWALLPDDPRYAGYLITYTHDAELTVDTTTSGDKLTARLDKVKPGGGSALYDAIYIACKNRSMVADEPYEPRRVIIVIGDGHDNASAHTLEEVIELAKREQVTIFGLSTVAYGMATEGQDILEKRLANEPGGRVVYPLNSSFKDISGYLSKPMDAGNYQYEAGTGGYAAEVSKSIIEAVESLQGEITTQYVLRYRPDIDPATANKEYRRIKVVIPSLPNARIRAKEGYYPNEAPTELAKPARPIGIASPAAGAKPDAPAKPPAKPPLP